ncbi:hypothetical protein [Halorussus sp. MSC15.2]|uniref:hypothetical protein n=1 Tax=Halorussus sp. MSC15.2 TaxID=2283638 RepID=UPI0013CFD179|nr:hypothetical protein [Halorussus sp. MSC15.2]NEU56849.1 hypothetical protein [Halorussus sp. MSC15.2]
MGSEREDSLSTDRSVSPDRDTPTEGDTSKDRDTSAGRDTSPDRGSSTERSASSRRVHVRKLDAVDTLRWSWHALTDRPELVGLVFVVSVLTVVTPDGVSRTAVGEPPQVADWAWPVYVALALAVALVWGVTYANADAAVEERPTSLVDSITSTATRLPALIVTAVLMWLVTAVGFLLLVLPGVYLFHRLVLAYPACVIDGKGPLASLRASWRASRGNVGKLFAVAFTYLALVGASNVLSGLFGRGTLASGVVSAGLAAGAIPLFGLAFGHLYLESSRNW